MYTVLLTHSSLFLVVSTHYRVQLFLFTFRSITSFVFDILCKRVFSRYVRKVQLWTPWLSYAVKLFGWYLSRNDNDYSHNLLTERSVFSFILSYAVHWLYGKKRWLRFSTWTVRCLSVEHLWPHQAALFFWTASEQLRFVGQNQEGYRKWRSML